MWNFQGTFETRKRSFFSAFSICMTEPLTWNIFHILLWYFPLSTLNKEMPAGWFQCISLSFNNSCSPGDIYLFKINDDSAKIMWKICSKLTIKAPEWRQWRHCGIFIVNLEKFYTMNSTFRYWLWTSKFRLVGYWNALK